MEMMMMMMSRMSFVFIVFSAVTQGHAPYTYMSDFSSYLHQSPKVYRVPLKGG